jgi:type III secretion protein L
LQTADSKEISRVGLVFLIDRPGYRLATDRKILKRRDAAVIEEITQAYVRAQGEISDALRNVEQACAKAADDAYRKGMAKAELEATRRWTLAEVERLTLLKSMLPTLADMVADAVTRLAKRIDREAFIAQAVELLQGSLRAATWARLRVHPDAVSAAEAAVGELDRHLRLGKLARVVADESLPPEGCVLESDLGTVDASLGTQLEAIRGAIADVVRQTVSASATRDVT